MKTRMTALFALLAASLTLTSFAATAKADDPYLVQVPGFNPIVGNSANQMTGFHIDPRTGRVVPHFHQDQVHASALDPNRHVIDPGSRRYVNQVRYDAYGRPYRVTGWRWTSYGVPHSELTSSWIQGGMSQGGFTQHHQQGVTSHRGGFSQQQQSVTSHRGRSQQSVRSFYNGQSQQPRYNGSQPRGRR